MIDYRNYKYEDILALMESRTLEGYHPTEVREMAHDDMRETDCTEALFCEEIVEAIADAFFAGIEAQKQQELR